MKKGQGSLLWLSVLRRSLALFMVIMVVWICGLTAQFEPLTRWISTLANSPLVVTALLQSELGAAQSAIGLEPWAQLVLSQSPTLLSHQEASWGSGTQATEPEPEAEPSPSASAEFFIAPTEAPVAPDDPDDHLILSSTATDASQVVGQTITGGEGYEQVDGVYINNDTDLPLDTAVLASGSLELTLPTEGPQILIIHTHGTEAYTPDGDDQYIASGDARTTDSNYNVIRVGEEMAEIFRSQGFQVLHDTNLYDYPDYDGSYERSYAAVQAHLEEYPSISVVLDVHRDALIGSDGTIYKPVTTLDGVSTAQVMLVMGSDALYLHDSWQDNLSLAVQIQAKMDSLWPTLTRPISLKENRYNQQLTTGSLLVEIGSHGNTLQEALVAARYFARAMGSVLLECWET